MIIRELNRAKMVFGFMEKCTSIACNCNIVGLGNICKNYIHITGYYMQWPFSNGHSTYDVCKWYLVFAWPFVYLPGI